MLDWASEIRFVVSRGDCLRLVVDEVAKDHSLAESHMGGRGPEQHLPSWS
jgi:hypothetical protein